MGHKLFTACGCGVESKSVVLFQWNRTTARASKTVGNTPDNHARRIVIGFSARKQSDRNCIGGNLNAYNVLKQHGIAKPEDYSNIEFRVSMINQISEKPLANHANKKATDV
ncbi:hypothetical protein ACIPMZ_18250 [Scandinavium goeteborgense]|jgi:hypothetical protein|uniref:hypothetical protein n=1 Tax=Scandinavium goeteborgense TaxID=1851514 RepID=UPI0011B3981A|nr:hypothetical protein [Scandinavium goeteborgense]MCS2153039.1 hypothetical protein [Scandinavium goeteborgense]